MNEHCRLTIEAPEVEVTMNVQDNQTAGGILASFIKGIVNFIKSTKILKIFYKTYLGLKFLYITNDGKLTTIRARAAVVQDAFDNEGGNLLLANSQDMKEANVKGLKIVDDIVPEPGVPVPLKVPVSAVGQNALNQTQNGLIQVREVNPHIL